MKNHRVIFIVALLHASTPAMAIDPKYPVQASTPPPTSATRPLATAPVAVPVKPVGATGLTTPQPSVAMRGVMRLNPAKFKSGSAVNPALSGSGIQAACNAIDPNHYTQALRTIEGKEDSCIAASYTAEDQRAAGCTGTETLDDCQVRLYNFCLDRNGDRAKFRAAASQELALVTQAINKLDAQKQYIQNTLSQHSGVTGSGVTGRYLPPQPRVPDVKMTLERLRCSKPGATDCP